MKTVVLLAFFLSSIVFGANQCIVCHKGIEDIRDRDSGMMKAILKVAKKAGHEGNDCIVCHGGNPKSKSKKYAHKGTPKYFKTHKGPKGYYSAPARAAINENTCGICHPNQVASQMNSLMMTQQGDIQDAMWLFGAKEHYNHNVAKYKTKNPQDKELRVGSDRYRKYMDKLSSKEPQAFPTETDKLPDAPSVAEVHDDPSLAVFTYLHQEQLRYNVGCASCHIPYSNASNYKRGDLLTHQIQSSRKVKVSVNDNNYSGVPIESCATCHSSGKSIASSYRGHMQNLHMKEDVHYNLGMLCQDCHTSNDLHGDGFLSGANLGSVEIECQDCHGTTSAYPWELPIGYSDEFNTTVQTGESRGVAQTIAEYLKQGYVAKKEDGYILSARGNPLPKAVKKGNKILMHLSNGKDIELKPLKLLKEQKKLSQNALIAMDEIDAHTSEMECYTCHATWAPQSYGNQLKIDYSKNQKNRLTQTQGYLRWEEPALAQNGEGRISPVTPNNQATITVIGRAGEALLQNHIYKIPDVEGRVNKGVSAMDISPVQPHTTTKETRSCESCHTSPKALGLGIEGISTPNYSQFVDKNGEQIMTVGHHFKLSQALDKEQRDKVDRRGVCISCHQEIPEGNLAISAMHHISEMSELNIDTKEHMSILNKILNISAWFQILAVASVLLLFIYVMYTVFIKKKSINPRNRGWK